ncbi:DNA photo-lyase FAD-binding domain-containing protein [Skeletonema marinoi]|uniref:DNA photo-lyase FAD-binding domain-containing protein n=1 Tax=Skeletonema marinoi TaxID=267567 RepID=A0AAD9DEA0_9STRA|nr:DNA photo-lyase FAD-binding domain-containing protein [Skeletonema marinoi]
MSNNHRQRQAPRSTLSVYHTLSVRARSTERETVHGSHVAFVNEGLVDLDLRLSSGNSEPTATNSDIQGDIYEHKFQCITVCRAGAAFTLRSIHKQRPINQILCHMESSHLKSFARDKAVRRWCRHEQIPIKEMNQTGVTRCLSDRDDFRKTLTSSWDNRYMQRQQKCIITKQKQEELRAAKKKAPSTPSPWLRSLASFQSRMHWRSHFIQKLESQPSLEKQDQCLAFSHLRRQPDDFNEKYFEAWCQGRTGFPFVDACMRSLIHTGWLNFRMRAMLVSFATYNLWLDWKKIAGHLARLFLDYEPGIHYPQLQMQAGTTGINAMRVYNVTKQGKDQDPSGVFIKKYVPELATVPDEYIHEPHKMPASLQKKCGVVIGDGKGGNEKKSIEIFQTQQSTTILSTKECICYPSPIVDEKITAKSSKDKLSAVRKQDSTKREAEQVYLKHGSRRTNGDRDGAKPKALNSASKRVKVDSAQQSLMKSWSQSQNGGGIK